MGEFAYPGTELELFAEARNWKRYWRDLIAPYLHGSVLEVGAGIGANTAVLVPRHMGAWTCLEPDTALLEQARRRLTAAGIADRCVLESGTVRTLAPTETFESILYLDVLEHIADDRLELADAARHLTGGGCIVVLAPAHQALFTDFDHVIGHQRRYDRRSLAAIAPPELRCERLFYVDSVGMCASLANRMWLHQRMPSRRQIRTWDRVMVPLSRIVDPLLLRRVGKSIVGVWRASVAHTAVKC